MSAVTNSRGRELLAQPLARFRNLWTLWSTGMEAVTRAWPRCRVEESLSQLLHDRTPRIKVPCRQVQWLSASRSPHLSRLYEMPWPWYARHGSFAVEIVLIRLERTTPS